MSERSALATQLYSVITLCLPLLLVITRNNILDSLLISIGLFGRYFKNILICVKFSRYIIIDQKQLLLHGD